MKSSSSLLSLLNLKNDKDKNEIGEPEPEKMISGFDDFKFIVNEVDNKIKMADDNIEDEENTKSQMLFTPKKTKFGLLMDENLDKFPVQRTSFSKKTTLKPHSYKILVENEQDENDETSLEKKPVFGKFNQFLMSKRRKRSNIQQTLQVSNDKNLNKLDNSESIGKRAINKLKKKTNMVINISRVFDLNISEVQKSIEKNRVVVPKLFRADISTPVNKKITFDSTLKDRFEEILMNYVEMAGTHDFWKTQTKEISRGLQDNTIENTQEVRVQNLYLYITYTSP